MSSSFGRSIPADFPPWEDVYRTLIREQMAFHCSTGKDRTGVAWRDVEEDYLISNVFLSASRPEIMDRWVRVLEERGVRLDLNTSKQLEHFLLVEPSYLAAARDEMIALDGSVDAYIRGSLRIDDGVRDTLRRQLLL